MTSVLLLERPGRWRAATAAALFLLAALPLLPLVLAALRAPGAGVGAAFWRTFATSAAIALGASLVGLAFGLPLGVGSALSAFPCRRVALVGVGLPLVVPSFLWAIGWSVAASTVTRGPAGCVIVAATTSTALVLFASYAATLELSRAQLDAALLAGGEGARVGRAIHHAWLPAVFAAMLAAVLTLSDPGPGQILGAQTVASEILTAFAAQYDLGLAARQCLILILVVGSLALPLAWIAGPRFVHAVLARQITAPGVPGGGPLGRTVALGSAAFLVLAVVPPVGALLVPLVGSEPSGVWSSDHLVLLILGAIDTAARTAGNTLLYAGAAGVLATLLGTVIALAVGRSPRLRTAAAGVCIVVFAWPPAASALGVSYLAATAPAALDFLLRSRFTVCLVPALHLAPVATVLALRAMGALPPSWTYAAAIHGLSVPRFLRLVLWPALRPTLGLSIALVALLASADAGSVLLLHPPGEASLPLAIFTVMANAPEAAVAALCLVYFVATMALFAGVLALTSRR